MCFPSGAAAPAPVQTVAAVPPPPPLKDPKAPQIDPNKMNGQDTASANRRGTSLFRNDLSLPTTSGFGSGLNIPR